MKVNFELSVDKNGMPIVSFNHHFINKSLEQKVLGVFIESALSKGIELKQMAKCREAGADENNNFDKYEIQLK